MNFKSRATSEGSAVARKEEGETLGHHRHPLPAGTCQQACTNLNQLTEACAECTLHSHPRRSPAAMLAATAAMQRRQIWLWLLPMIIEEDAVEGGDCGVAAADRESCGRTAARLSVATAGEVKSRPCSSCDARHPDEDSDGADICGDSGESEDDVGRSSLRTRSPSSSSLSLISSSSEGSLGGSSGSLRGSSSSLTSASSLDAELDRLARDAGRSFGPEQGGEEEDAPSPSSAPTSGGMRHCPVGGPVCCSSGPLAAARAQAAAAHAFPAAAAVSAPHSCALPAPSPPYAAPLRHDVNAVAMAAAALWRRETRAPFLPVPDTVWAPDVIELVWSKPRHAEPFNPGSRWIDYVI